MEVTQETYVSLIFTSESTFGTAHRYSASLSAALRFYISLQSPFVSWKHVGKTQEGTTIDKTVYHGKAITRGINTFTRTLHTSVNVTGGQTGTPALTDLLNWNAVIQSTGLRVLWDKTIENCVLLESLNAHTKTTRTTLKAGWPRSPRDFVMIESALIDKTTMLHIGTSIENSADDPSFLRTLPPHVRGQVYLNVWFIEVVPPFSSLVGPSSHAERTSVKVTHYYSCDTRSARALNMETAPYMHRIDHVKQILSTFGVPPFLLNADSGVQVDQDEYDPKEHAYELRCSILEPEENGGFARTTEYLVAPQTIKAQPATQANKNIGSTSSACIEVQVDTRTWGYDHELEFWLKLNGLDYSRSLEDLYIPQSQVSMGTSVKAVNGWSLALKSEDDCSTMIFSLRCVRPHRGSNETARIQLLINRRENASGDNTVLVNGLRCSVSAHSIAPSMDLIEIDARTTELCHISDAVERTTTPVRHSDDRQVYFPEREGSLQRRRILGERERVLEEIRSEAVLSSRSPQRRSSSAPPMLTITIPKDKSKATLEKCFPISQSSPSFSGLLSSASSSIQTFPSIRFAPIPQKLTEAHRFFNTLLASDSPSLPMDSTVWRNLGTMRNGIGIFQKPILGHPIGILKGVGVFKDVGLFDIVSIIECGGARKIWDPRFDDSVVLDVLPSGCVLHYSKLKATWPASPRDAVTLSSTFLKSPCSIQLVAVSAPDDFPEVLPPQANYVRADVELSGWQITQSPTWTHLQSDGSVNTGLSAPIDQGVDARGFTTRVEYIVKSHPGGWIPASLLSAVIRDLPLSVAYLVDYYEEFGAPPYLIYCRRGKIFATDYDHQRASFMVKYGVSRLKRRIKSTNSNDPLTHDAVGVDLLIRLDVQKWGKGRISFAVLPPPRSIIAFRDEHDSTGLRVLVRHLTSDIAAGSIAPPTGLVITLHVTRDGISENAPALVVNGIPITEIHDEAPTSHSVKEQFEEQTSLAELRQSLIGTPPINSIGGNASFSISSSSLAMSTSTPTVASLTAGARSSISSLAYLMVKRRPKAPSSQTDTDAGLHARWTSTPSPVGGRVRDEMGRCISPSSRHLSLRDVQRPPSILSSKSVAATLTDTSTVGLQVVKDPSAFESSPEYKIARKTLGVLKRIFWEKDSGWTNVTVDKTGLEMHRRYIPEVSTSIPVMRGVKLIEGYDVSEVAAVVASMGSRLVWDDMLESGQILSTLKNGCRIAQCVLKPFFILKARELITLDFCECSRTAASPSMSPPVYFVSCSIPYTRFSDTEEPSSEEQYRGNLFLSGYILDPVDPYGSSSHPIPSTRVTTFSSLDQSGSVPYAISTFIASSIPKRICGIEEYLQKCGPPPFVIFPPQMVPEGEHAATDSSTASGSGGSANSEAYHVYSEEFDHPSATYEVQVDFYFDDIRTSSLPILPPSSSSSAEASLLEAGQQEDLIITDILVNQQRYPAGYRVHSHVVIVHLDASTECDVETPPIPDVRVLLYNIPPPPGYSANLRGRITPQTHLIRILHVKAPDSIHDEERDEKTGPHGNEAHTDILKPVDKRETDMSCDLKLRLIVRVLPAACHDTVVNGDVSSEVDVHSVKKTFVVNDVQMEVLSGRREWIKPRFGTAGRMRPQRSVPTSKQGISYPRSVSAGDDVLRPGSRKGMTWRTITERRSSTASSPCTPQFGPSFPITGIDHSPAPVNHSSPLWTTLGITPRQMVGGAVLVLVTGTALVTYFLGDPFTATMDTDGSLDSVYLLGRIFGFELILRRR